MEINPCEWIFLLAPNSCAFFCFFSLVPNSCNLFDTQTLRKFPWKSIAVGGFFRWHPTLANLQQIIPQSLRAFSLHPILTNLLQDRKPKKISCAFFCCFFLACSQFSQIFFFFFFCNTHFLKILVQKELLHFFFNFFHPNFLSQSSSIPNS